MDGGSLEKRRAYARFHAKKHSAKNRNKHTPQWYDTVGNLQTATCIWCGLTGNVLGNFFKNASYKNGFQSACRKCQLQRNREAECKREYGISIADRTALWIAVGRKCEICGVSTEERSFHLDHDHMNGIVRGALCCKCNLGLGSFSDSPEKLRFAADYIERKRIV